MSFFFIILGLALIAWSISWLALWVVRLLTWLRATGAVVRLVDGLAVGDTHACVRFESVSGCEIEFTSRFCVLFPLSWRPGRRVRVLYHPIKNEKAVILSIGDMTAPLFIAAFGALFLYMGNTGLP